MPANCPKVYHYVIKLLYILTHKLLISPYTGALDAYETFHLEGYSSSNSRPTNNWNEDPSHAAARPTGASWHVPRLVGKLVQGLTRLPVPTMHVYA